MTKKNIIIQSEKDDGSTDDVLSWLHYLYPSIKINTLFDLVNIQKIKIEINNHNDLSVNINGITVNETTNYWYRRGVLKYTFVNTESSLSEIEKKIHQEYISPLVDFVNKGSSSYLINRYSDNSIGKLEQLYHAMKLNINIPSTLVSENLDDVRLFVKKHGKVITKPTRNPFTNIKITDKRVNFICPTTLITEDTLIDKPHNFLPSLFQQYIEKKFEIRAFYLNGQFYSMAIFSQENEKTKIDFRNYDHKKPNRLSPILLPKILKSKLTALMNKMELNSGSFDLIYTPDKKFYFLEVNPIGQFQWLSRHCNYYLEKKIATYLLENHIDNG